MFSPNLEENLCFLIFLRDKYRAVLANQEDPLIHKFFFFLISVKQFSSLKYVCLVLSCSNLGFYIC